MKNNSIKNNQKYLNFTKNFIKNEANYNRYKSLRFFFLSALALTGLATLLSGFFFPMFSFGFYSMTLSGLALANSGTLLSYHYNRKMKKLIKTCGLSYYEFREIKNNEEFINLKNELKNNISVPYTYLENKNFVNVLQTQLFNKLKLKQNVESLEK